MTGYKYLVSTEAEDGDLGEAIECSQINWKIVSRAYGVPFSHLFPELQIYPIEVHISPIQLQITTIDLQISTIQLEISTNRPYLQISPIEL